jgi:ATP-dependent DNA helicase RecG
MYLTKSLLHTTDVYIKKLHEAWIETTEQLIEYFPRDIEDKSEVATRFSTLTITEKQVVKCRIELLTSETTRNKKLLIKAVLVDADGSYAEAVWFNRKFLLQQFASGDTVLIYSQPKYEYGRLSFPNSEIEKEKATRREIVPVYSDLNYIPGAWIREKISLIRNQVWGMSDEVWVPKPIREKKGLRTRSENIIAIHFPTSLEDWDRARAELGYEELYHFQRRGLEKKYALERDSLGLAPALTLDTELMRSLIESLPFPLTNKQKIVLFQILKDMERPHAMARMLQGDVGTGKTVVAMLAAVHAILVSRKKVGSCHVDNGDILLWKTEQDFSQVRNDGNLQVAIMAPTEILARQHFTGQEAWLIEWGIRSDLLVGSLTPRMKEDARARLKSWDTDIIFGTHALIQDSVQFSRLGFVVVDEQHRFGVEQRKALEEYISMQKAESRKQDGNIIESNSPLPTDNCQLTTAIAPHRLNMSATPIPRSLALTLYGDQDISVLDEYPAGRLPIHTRVVKEEKRHEIYNWIAEEVKSGRQVYWISPLVEESETLDIASATNMQEVLSGVFPTLTIGLIHGKMSGKDKDRIMQEFYENKIHILSSTSVVEVGVNNPNASVICIEASERFGLSQLHQFRGRVGRGVHQSYCYLFTTKEYKSDRLKAMESTNDGFELAQIDLDLRGPGEVYGVRQSWVPDFFFADLRDTDLIAEIRGDIEEWMRSIRK